MSRPTGPESRRELPRVVDPILVAVSVPGLDALDARRDVSTQAGSAKAGRMRLIAARILTILAVLVVFVGMLSFAVE